MSLYSLLLRRASLLPIFLASMLLPGAASAAPIAPHKVIVDMDIGDDIDDAFALALLLQSPDIEIIGITTAWGDTALRTRLLERFLRDTGHAGIPVAQGAATANPTPFTQARYALRGQAPAKAPEDAASFIVREVARQPGQVTVLALGPLTNIGAAIARDKAAFGKVKQVVMMGGSVRAGSPSGVRMSQNIRAVPLFDSPRHGRIWKVEGSGRAIMSASKTRARPSIAEPSNPMPS